MTDDQHPVGVTPEGRVAFAAQEPDEEDEAASMGLPGEMPHAVDAIRGNPDYVLGAIDRAVRKVGPVDAYGWLRDMVKWIAGDKA